MSTSKLTPDQVRKATRRQNALERIANDTLRADNERVRQLYAVGSVKRAADAPAPQFKPAEKFFVTRLPGGLTASTAATKAAATRRGRPLDTSPEAEAKRARRRERRAARKARQAAALLG